MWAECSWVEALVDMVHCFNISSQRLPHHPRRNDGRCAIDRPGARPSRMIVSGFAPAPQFAVAAYT